MLLDETYIDLREELANAKAQAEARTEELQVTQRQWDTLLQAKAEADARVAAIELLLQSEGAPVPVADKFVTFGDGVQG